MNPVELGIFRLLTLLVCLFTFQVGYSRDCPVAEYQLVIWFNEGYDLEKLEVPFSESPEFSIDGDEVVFLSASMNPNFRELRFLHSDLDCFTIEEYSPVSTSIELTSSVLEYKDGIIKVCANPGLLVQVINLSGIVLEERSVPRDGGLTLSIVNMPRGTYIIRCGNLSCKVTR